MKKTLFFLLTLSVILPESYSWEDGGTILGSYGGNVSNPLNVGSFNGVDPYDGDYMLSVSESPLDGTPKAYVAYIQNLNPGDIVTASFYTYDSFSGSPSARIWGGYVSNTDINSYQGSAGGNATYPSGTGWEELSHTWTIAEGKEALVVEARLYSGSDDPTVKVAEAENIKNWNTDAELHIIKNADHVLGGFHPYDLDEYPAHLQEAIGFTIAFLKK